MENCNQTSDKKDLMASRITGQDKDTKLADMLIEYVENCSWDEVKPDADG